MQITRWGFQFLVTFRYKTFAQLALEKGFSSATNPAGLRQRRCNTKQVGPALPTVTGIPYLHEPSHLLVGAQNIGRLTSLTAGIEGRG
jgi:hypothetical protein